MKTSHAYERYLPDLEAYYRRARGGRCFVCAIVARDPQLSGHHVVHEDGATIAFLTKHPTQYGYTMVCPKEHREQATADFSAEEYLALQRAVLHRVAEAVREEVGAERMYVLRFRCSKVGTGGGRVANRDALRVEQCQPRG